MPDPIPDASGPAPAGPSVVGPGTSVEGEVAGGGDLVVHGVVRGRVRLAGSLTVEPSGAVEADVTAGGTVLMTRSVPSVAKVLVSQARLGPGVRGLIRAKAPA